MADPALPVYLINLDHSRARLERVGTSLTRAGLSYERIPAVNGAAVNLDVARDCDQRAATSFLGRPLSAAEYGCYRSHLLAAQRLLESGAPHGIVLEDDIEVSSRLPVVVAALLQRPELTRPGWDLVHLGADRLKYVTPLGQATLGHRLLAAHYFPMTTCALLWSRDGARRFVEDFAMTRMPVDFQLRQAMVRSGRGMAVWPPLASQVEPKSEIADDRRRAEADRSRWSYGLQKRRRLMVNKTLAGLQMLRWRLARGLPPAR